MKLLGKIDMKADVGRVADLGLHLACVLDEDASVCVRCEAELEAGEPHRDDCEVYAVLSAAGYTK